MRSTITRHTTAMDAFRNSSLHAILHAEMAEIKKLKWIESEKAQHDIGINKAIIMWGRHRQKWLDWFKEQI